MNLPKLNPEQQKESDAIEKLLMQEIRSLIAEKIGYPADAIIITLPLNSPTSWGKWRYGVEIVQDKFPVFSGDFDLYFLGAEKLEQIWENHYGDFVKKHSFKRKRIFKKPRQTLIETWE